MSKITGVDQCQGEEGSAGCTFPKRLRVDIIEKGDDEQRVGGGKRISQAAV